MTRPFKTSLQFLLSLIIVSVLSDALFAQQVKKTTTTQKNTTTVVKKPIAKSKTSTVVKKPAATTPVKQATTVNTTSSANPVATGLNMSSREQQMVDEINLLRTDPPGYVKYIKDFLKTTNADKHVTTAANEAMDELKHLKPLNPLAINPVMYQDAKKFGVEMMQNNSTDHSDLPYNENLSFGIEDVRDVIVYLLIDEGISDRGHRKNLLNKGITQVAVHELPGKVEDYSNCYIQEFK